MTAFEEVQTLKAPGDEAVLRLPHTTWEHVLVYRVSGSFTGTLQARAEDSAGALTNLTSRNVLDGTTADPTAAGVYAADAGADARKVHVVASVLTSGAPRVELVAIAKGTA